MTKPERTLAMKTFFIVAFLLLQLLYIPANASDTTPSLTENQAKSALLYNFMKHTRWPEETSIKEFNVLFVGKQKSFHDDFLGITEKISIRGKKIRVTQTSDFSGLAGQHVLVLSPALNTRLANIAETLTRSGTLLVTDNATDQKLVMINFTYPRQAALSFEINKSNIVYEGLKISNDVLLHGGTEIEVATLYKEMEALLKTVKQDVELNKTELRNKIAEIDNKNAQITALKQEAENITRLLALQTAQINQQEARLLQLNQEFDAVKNSLDSSQSLLDIREKLVSDLEVEIDKNRNTLQQQQTEISAQQALIAEKSATVNRQDATISSQRNIINLVVALLLIFLLLIINRQKKALERARQLTETRAKLIAAQQESIKAYESSIKLKNDFLTAISHEMRTPMNGIIGAIQIADMQNPASMATSLDIITQSSAEMINLVDGILTYIEIQSEQMAVLNEPVQISHLFDALRQQYSHLCQEKSLQLNWHITNNLPTWINIDKNKFIRILENLLDNAVKFTDHGAITLIVRYQADTGGKGRISCTVKDTGTGIPIEEQHNVFTPFWQQESGFTRRFNGLGIGLTICQKLTQLMGGTIDMTSTVGQGSQFTITLDVCEAETPALTTATVKDASQPILIVEDNVINQQVLHMMLSKLGYQVLIANDGTEALEIIDQQAPGMILMDLQMPNMDGFTCTRKIRERRDNKQNIPIVAITANLMESQQTQCIEAGMNGYLAKPVEFDQLQKTLQQYLQA